MKNIQLPVKKFEWDSQHSLAFEDIKKAVANIAMIYYYNPSRETRVKCDASHSGLGATLEQNSEQNEWVPTAFASRYLNTQEKNTPQTSSNCLQLFGRLIGLNFSYWVNNLL